MAGVKHTAVKEINQTTGVCSILARPGLLEGVWVTGVNVTVTDPSGMWFCVFSSLPLTLLTPRNKQRYLSSFERQLEWDHSPSISYQEGNKCIFVLIG